MEGNKNVDIFICAHKEFKVCPNNPVYKVIHGSEELDVPLEQFVETPTDLSPMEFSLAEGSRIYWLWKNWELKDYIGICHYRKYFGFFEDIPDVDEMFKEHDIITTNFQMGCDINRAYFVCHRIQDLEDMKGVIRSVDSSWADEFEKCMNDKVMHPCNMFIMKSDDFKEYCGCVFKIIKEFCKKRKWKCDGDIKRYVKSHSSEYLKNFYPNNTIEYQARVLGYLLERLTSAYISSKFKNPYIVEITFTEEKYNNPNIGYEK